MVTNIPNVQNWTVTPQNGQPSYFTLMNTWLGQSTLVIASLQTAIVAQNKANSEINALAIQTENNAIVANGLANFQGAWSNSIAYSKGQSIEYPSGSKIYYISKVDNNLNHAVTDTNYWLYNPINDKLDKDFSLLTDKTTPIDTDILAIRETGGLLKKLSWANLKATLASLFVSKDANGNVGIGDSNPQYRLSIFSPTSLSSTAGSKLINISKATNVGGSSSFLQQQTVRTSTGSSHGSTEERLIKVVDTTEMGYVGFANNEVNIGVNSGKKFTLTESGLKVDFGSNTGETIWSNSSKSAGTDWRHFYGTSNGNTVANIIIYGNGNIVNTNNSYGALSDVKLKENIIDVTPKLDKLMKVRVVNYNLIGQDQKQIGVIAQEIEQIFPSLIDETKDTKQVEVEKERVIPAVEEVTEQKLVKEAVLNEDGEIVKEAIYQTVVITEAVAEHIEKYIELETIETGETTKSVKYSVLYMMMLKGMQEQQEIINSLTKRIEILEGAK